MPYFIINKEKTDGIYNEVHKTSCSHLPVAYNQINLGYHEDSKSAIQYAKSIGYPSADGCLFCCPESHRG